MQGVSLFDTYNQIFNYIWTSPLYKETEAEALKDYIQQLNPQNQALLISAIMLNLLEYFDIHEGAYEYDVHRYKDKPISYTYTKKRR